LLLKSPFEKRGDLGGFENLQGEEFMANAIIKKCNAVGAHPRVRPQCRADTWVRPYGEIAIRLGIGRE